MLPNVLENRFTSMSPCILRRLGCNWPLKATAQGTGMHQCQADSSPVALFSRELRAGNHSWKNFLKGKKLRQKVVSWLINSSVILSLPRVNTSDEQRTMDGLCFPSSIHSQGSWSCSISFVCCAFRRTKKSDMSAASFSYCKCVCVCSGAHVWICM